MVNIGIIGYNFSYFKGTWRNNLFHSELNFLIVFSAAFIGTVIHLFGNLMTPVINHKFWFADTLYSVYQMYTDIVIICMSTKYSRLRL